MKKLLFLAAVLTSFTTLSAQEPQQACYLDTALVEPLISRTDTLYMVKTPLCKGDWTLFYDFHLSNKKAEYHFDRNGNRTGTWKEWHANGKPASEWDYTKATLRYYPPGKAWYPSGALRTDRVQRNDSVVETTYFANGKTMRVNTWTNVGVLVRTDEYCSGGQQIVSYNPSAATPVPVKKYHCNGKLRAEYSWHAYGYVGAFTEYHENGKVAVKGQFEEIKPGSIVLVARKTGEWTYYDASGKVTKTEKWENGKLVR